jgi:hypothetical protein
MGKESAIRWRRSERCTGEAACVEIAFAGDRVLVRNSQVPDGPTATFSRAEWSDFIAGVKDDEFND